MKSLLPNLPKKNNTREANFSLRFREWLENNPRETCTFEMKDSRGKNYINFSEITPAQINFGQTISSDKGVLIRLHPFVEGTPDYVYLRDEPSYVVIKYPKSVEVISVNTLKMEIKRSQQKSLTKKRAKEISTFSIP